MLNRNFDNSSTICIMVLLCTYSGDGIGGGKKIERIELRLQPKSKTTDNGNNHQSNSGSPIDDVQSSQVNSASKIVDNNHQESPPKTGTQHNKNNTTKTLQKGSLLCYIA